MLLSANTTYRENGWSTASSEVLSGHRHVVQQRVKIPGAWWRPDQIAGEPFELSTIPSVDNLPSVDVDAECFGDGLFGDGFTGRCVVRAGASHVSHAPSCAGLLCWSNRVTSCSVAVEC
jgi:hypothetical protein